MRTSRYCWLSGRSVFGFALGILTVATILGLGPIGQLHAQDGSVQPPGFDIRIPYSIAIDGDFAVVGAPWHGNYRGAVYVLRRDARAWKQVQRLSPSDLAQFDHFGASVSIRGNRIIVGTPWHDLLRGAAYVYTLESDGWKQTQKLTASDASTESCFGAAVEATDAALMVRTRASAARGGGATYRFGLSGNQWSELATRDAPAPKLSTFMAGGRMVEGAAGSAALQDEAPALIELVERESGESPGYRPRTAHWSDGWR
jgi:hypothetical protein